jgi:putative effector of murein hydrolase
VVATAQAAPSSPGAKRPRGRVQEGAVATAPAPPPFSESTLNRQLRASALLGGASLLLATFGGDATAAEGWPNAVRTGFFTSATVAAYVWGARLPREFTSVVHPLVVASVLIMATMAAWGSVTSQSFIAVLRSYKVGSLSWTRAGAGDVLLYLLGPSVVSFALSMYGRRALLGTNLPVVGLAMLVSSVGGLYGTAGMVRLAALGGPNGRLVRLSVLARNVTTALAIALTNMLGGDISICASVVVLTGIVGATYGKALLNRAGVVDPVARGLAIGSSSQGLGVASMSDESDAFPFAAISMVLTAIAATTLVSIPAVKASIIQLATGSPA